MMSSSPQNSGTLSQALEAFRRGEIVIVVDDDDRENEGDLILSAQKSTAEKIAFVIRHTSGILCAAIDAATAQRFNLSPMVAVNDAPLSTAFTVSIDYRHGLSTGISAEERCQTLRALTNDNAVSSDFVRPGHVFPLIARQGGVLMRSGHTEAGVDLCKLTNQPPVGVLSELVNDDGTVMRGAQIDDFAQRHKLHKISVAELISYRQSRENLVERVNSFDLNTSIGPARCHSFRSMFDSFEHVAVVYGNPDFNKPMLVRLHREQVLDDVLGEKKLITAVYKRFEQEGSGILVYLREGAAGVPYHMTGPEKAADKIHNAPIEGTGEKSQQSREMVWREVGLGAQILRNLGVSSIRLLSMAPRQFIGLSGFDIDIVETEIFTF